MRRNNIASMESDCHIGCFYSVASSIDAAPLGEYMLHGYETRNDFHAALTKTLDYWGGRTGECIDMRNGHLLLLFHDTPGGCPDRAWLPLYLLEQEPPPDGVDDGRDANGERELDEAFGFD